jgi:peptidoglycan/LPS O-acetylase OafA/YrhL
MAAATAQERSVPEQARSDTYRYRADIDGLRAIAAIAVLLHHVGAEALPGGYVGVDIFFVISGYLITGHIAQQLQSGAFSILGFYQRRINRIIPALATVVVVTLAAGTVLLSPNDLRRLTLTGPLAIAGLSNIYFWREYGSYFGANTAEAPLIHTWSLGVEEQFYLLWPALLVLLFRLGRRHVAWLLTIFVAAGIAVSQYGLTVAASASYYLIPTRFFELGIGGVICFLPPASIIISKSRTLLSFGGILLLLLALCMFTPKTPFPGFAAMVPCLGAAFLIVSNQSWINRSLLGNKVMASIGLISYSIYLWHWPIIAYLNYVGATMGLMSGVLVIVATMLLAWATWYFVETPYRRSGRTMPFSTVFAYRYLGPIGLVSATALVGWLTHGLDFRFQPQVAELESSTLVKPNELRTGCHVPTALFATDPSEQCKLGAKDQAISGLLVGDSYANHFSGLVDAFAADAHLAVMDYTMDGCAPIKGWEPTDVPTSYARKCELRNERIYKMIKNRRFKYVILSAHWPTEPSAVDYLRSSLAYVVAAKSIPVVLLANQTIPHAATCEVRHAMFPKLWKQRCSSNQKPQPRYWRELQRDFPTAVIVDPDAVICHAGTCSPSLDGKIVYRDEGHLNDVGSRLIAAEFLSSGFNPFTAKH